MFEICCQDQSSTALQRGENFFFGSRQKSTTDKQISMSNIHKCLCLPCQTQKRDLTACCLPFFHFERCSLEHARIFSTFELKKRRVVHSNAGCELELSTAKKRGKRNFVELRNETFPQRKEMPLVSQRHWTRENKLLYLHHYYSNLLFPRPWRVLLGKCHKPFLWKIKMNLRHF